MARDLDDPPYYFMTPGNKLPQSMQPKCFAHYSIGGKCPLCSFGRLLQLVDDSRWVLEVCPACGLAGGYDRHDTDHTKPMSGERVWLEVTREFERKLRNLGLFPGREGLRQFVRLLPEDEGLKHGPFVQYTPQMLAREILRIWNTTRTTPHIKLLTADRATGSSITDPAAMAGELVKIAEKLRGLGAEVEEQKKHPSLGQVIRLGDEIRKLQDRLSELMARINDASGP